MCPYYAAAPLVNTLLLLQCIYFSCSITSIPTWMNSLLVLEKLNLNTNRITMIPVLDQLRALEWFDFGNNNVDTELDVGTFYGCSSLKTIKGHDFTANPLGTFDVTLQLTATVEFFDIGWSRVTSINISCIPGAEECSLKTILWNKSPVTCKLIYFPVLFISVIFLFHS